MSSSVAVTVTPLAGCPSRNTRPESSIDGALRSMNHAFGEASAARSAGSSPSRRATPSLRAASGLVSGADTDAGAAR